jgi:putative transposase
MVARVLGLGCKVSYAFMAEHRPLFSVRGMCRCLRLHPGGFYAWAKNPLSLRAHKDAHQIKLLKVD